MSKVINRTSYTPIPTLYRQWSEEGGYIIYVVANKFLVVEIPRFGGEGWLVAVADSLEQAENWCNEHPIS